jgi:hypothetical protein
MEKMCYTVQAYNEMEGDDTVPLVSGSKTGSSVVLSPTLELLCNYWALENILILHAELKILEINHTVNGVKDLRQLTFLVNFSENQNRGIWRGLDGLIPVGGHEDPNSIVVFYSFERNLCLLGGGVRVFMFSFL